MKNWKSLRRDGKSKNNTEIEKEVIMVYEEFGKSAMGWKEKKITSQQIKKENDSWLNVMYNGYENLAMRGQKKKKDNPFSHLSETMSQ